MENIKRQVSRCLKDVVIYCIPFVGDYDRRNITRNPTIRLRVPITDQVSEIKNNLR